jgi:hypothetical protein
MSVFQLLQGLSGNWHGNSKLWLTPTDQPHTCETTAHLTPIANGKFVRLDYTWEYEGQPQAGSYLFGYDRQRETFTAVWVDSWHMGDKLMPCEGDRKADSTVDVVGGYAAPPGPDWGWRTVIDSFAADSFRLLMYNIRPDGAQELAVEALYRRI